MQYKPGNWVTGFKRSPRAANVQHRDMGLFLNSSGKFEPIDDSWDNLHSGGLFISDDNKLYFRDETNKDIYINSPAAETLGLSAGNATTAGFVTINEEGFDTDFRVEASGVTHALFVQGSDGNVGIGEPSPANLLHVKVDDVGIAPHASSQIALERDGTNYLQFLTANTGTSGLLFGDTADVDVAKIVYDHNVPHMVFTTEAAAAMTIDGSQDVTVDAGNLVIGTAGKGIDFSAQSSPAAGMTSELLDHYEEGTWTAELKGLTSAATTPVTVTGCYTRIGRQVNLTAFFSNVDTSGASGSMAVSGYPFTPPSTDAFRAAGSTVTYGLSVPNKGLTPTNQGAVDRCQFYSPTDDGGWTGVNITAGSGKYLFLTITYVV